MIFTLSKQTIEEADLPHRQLMVQPGNEELVDKPAPLSMQFSRPEYTGVGSHSLLRVSSHPSD